MKNIAQRNKKATGIERVIPYLALNGPSTRREIEEELGITRWTVSRILKQELEPIGIVEFEWTKDFDGKNEKAWKLRPKHPRGLGEEEEKKVGRIMWKVGERIRGNIRHNKWGLKKLEEIFGDSSNLLEFYWRCLTEALPKVVRRRREKAEELAKKIDGGIEVFERTGKIPKGAAEIYLRFFKLVGGPATWFE